MQKLGIDVVGGSYQAISVPLSCQRTVNWIPCLAGNGALSESFLDDPSGIIDMYDLGNGSANRGVHVMNGVAYFVNGGKLYSASLVNSTELGSISGTKRVSMADNGSKLVIVVPGAQTYVYDTATGVLSNITAYDNFIASSTVVFLDGYFVFSASNGNVFFNSDLSVVNSPLPLTFQALSFGRAVVSPDKIVGLHVSHNELYVIGSETIELFQNTGGTAIEIFPFQRINGAFIQKGCYSALSIVDFNNTFIFIGGGLNEKVAVWMVTGSNTAEKISNAGIELELQKFSTAEIQNAFSFTWSERGSFFAAFTVQSNNISSRTFVFDSSTNEWHERQTGVGDNCWRVSGIANAYGRLICADLTDDRVGYLDTDTFEDYGDYRQRIRICAPFFEKELPLFQGQMELYMQPGVGLTASTPATQGEDPQIVLSYSDDGGQYSPYIESGQYANTQIGNMLGQNGQAAADAAWNQSMSPGARFLEQQQNAALLRNKAALGDVGGNQLAALANQSNLFNFGQAQTYMGNLQNQQGVGANMLGNYSNLRDNNFDAIAQARNNLVNIKAGASIAQANQNNANTTNMIQGAGALGGVIGGLVKPKTGIAGGNVLGDYSGGSGFNLGGGSLNVSGNANQYAFGTQQSISSIKH